MKSLFSSVLMTALMIVSPALGNVVTFEFTGTITEVVVDSFVRVGDTFTGQFSYDRKAPGEPQSTTNGEVLLMRYDQSIPPAIFTYTIFSMAGEVLFTASVASVMVGNNWIVDGEALQADTFFVGGSVAACSACATSLLFYDFSLTRFKNTKMPANLDLEASTQ